MTTTTSPVRTPEIEGFPPKRSPVLLATIAILALAVVGLGLWLILDRNSVSIEDETAAIEQLVIDQEAAQNAGDADAMMAMLAEDAVVFMNDMPAIVGREAFATAYGQVFGPVFVSTDLEISETVIAESGDMAWVYGTQAMELNLPEAGLTRASGKWMTVMEKVDGEWMVTALTIAEVAP